MRGFAGLDVVVLKMFELSNISFFQGPTAFSGETFRYADLAKVVSEPAEWRSGVVRRGLHVLRTH